MIQIKFQNIALTMLELVNSTNLLMILLNIFLTFQGQNNCLHLLLKLCSRTYLKLKQVLQMFKN